MLRWCSYCQTFLGESPPYDNLEETHGICTECATRGESAPEAMEAVKRRRELLSSLKQMCQGGELDESFVQEAIDLGLMPFDVLAGMLQPWLYELGRLFAAGKIAVADEHRATAVISTVVAEIQRYVPAEKSQGPVDVMLFVPNGNYHDLGVKMLSILLRQEGISCSSIVPGLPNDEILSAAVARSCKVLGLSISQPMHFVEAKEIAESLRALEPAKRPKLAVGGSYLATLPAESTAFADYAHNPRDFKAFAAWVRSVI